MRKIFMLLAGVFLINSLQAQTAVAVRDFELWSGVGVKKKLAKGVSATFDFESRFRQNSSEVDQVFGDLGLKFKLHKRFALGMGYRYIRSQDDELRFETRHRWNLDAMYNVKLFDDLRLEYRFRFTHRDDAGVSPEEGDYPVKYIRNRVSLDYNIKDWKLDPVFSVELFRRYEQYTIPEFDKLRFTLSTNYKFKGLGTAKFFYRIERELNARYPMTTNIVGVKFRFKL